ncbi:MAG: hypothetical protein JNM36_05920 [Chitinophagales bacterium]|jgi:hypothetical protein|nr:hypothetical protein [Chitinophagales bacterium]
MSNYQHFIKIKKHYLSLFFLKLGWQFIGYFIPTKTLPKPVLKFALVEVRKKERIRKGYVHRFDCSLYSIHAKPP